MTEPVDVTKIPAEVFVRVGDDNEFEAMIGTFTLETTHVSPGDPVIEVVAPERPLAALLRRYADAVERDEELPGSRHVYRREIQARREIITMWENQDGYDLPEGVHDGRDPGERERDAAVKDTLETVLRILAAYRSSSASGSVSGTPADHPASNPA